MSATAKQPAADCGSVATRSVLTSRRVRAHYVRSAASCRRRGLLLMLPAALLLLLGLAHASRPAPPSTVRDRPLPLSELTAVNGLDRFNLTHTVEDDETLWEISVRFYGTPELQIMQAANPSLPKELKGFKKEFKIGLHLKVPVR